MKGSAYYFYADKTDLEDLLRSLGELGSYCYTKGYWDANDSIPTYCDPLAIPNIGTVAPTHVCPDVGYLVAASGVPLRPEEIKLTDGRIRFKVSNATTPDSVRLSLGGDAGDRTLIASALDTRAYTAEARALFSSFKKVIASTAKKVNRENVLPGAYKKLLDGWRLTTGKSYSRKMDLMLPSKE